MPETVEPRLSRGLRDLLPDQMLARQRMIDTIRGVYELYGFVPLTTPAIEYLDVLSGSSGPEIQESIFLVQNPEEEQLALRFDHTVPLARVIAQYKDLPKPFRRYTIGPVWRADKLEKIGIAKVRLELTTGYTDESGDKIPGLSLTPPQVDQIERFLGIHSAGRSEVVKQLHDTFGSIPGADEEIAVLEKMSHYLD